MDWHSEEAKTGQQL